MSSAYAPAKALRLATAGPEEAVFNETYGPACFFPLFLANGTFSNPHPFLQRGSGSRTGCSSRGDAKIDPGSLLKRKERERKGKRRDEQLLDVVSLFRAISPPLASYLSVATEAETRCRPPGSAENLKAVTSFEVSPRRGR